MTVIIHVGMSKAASTTIQNIVNSHNQFYYFGKYTEDKRASGKIYSSPQSEYLTKSLVNLDRFSGLSKLHTKKIDKELKFAKKNKKVFFFSNEHFCESTCAFFQGEILKEVFKNPKVLIIIRNQIDAIKSLYKFAGYFLRFAPNPLSKKIVKFDDFFDYLHHNYKNTGGHKARDWVADYFRILDFSSFIKINEKIFGKKNIIIVPFELFIKDFDFLLRAIKKSSSFNFSNGFNKKAHDNSTSHLAARNLKLIYYLSKLPFQKVLKKINKVTNLNLIEKLGKGTELEMSEKQVRKIHEIYASGNNELSKRYSIDLKSLGYPL